VKNLLVPVHLAINMTRDPDPLGSSDYPALPLEHDYQTITSGSAGNET
jgi:hypothetical protein